MAAAQKEALRKTLDNLSVADFKRFKHHLKDQGPIPWGKLEKADTDDTVESMVQVYTIEAGDVIVTILQKMNHNQMAMELERHLLRCNRATQTVTKSSLKQKLQKHFKNKFCVVHQDWGVKNLQEIYTDLYIVQGHMSGVNSTHEVSTLTMRQTGRGPSSEDKQVLLANMFTDRSATKVLTLGIAGVGKTVAVQKFVMDWAEGYTNQDIDFVFVLLFCEMNLKTEKCYSLLDLLLAFYTDLEDLRKFPQFSESKILFVLDGLDESRLQLDFDNCISKLNEESFVETLMSSLIKGTLLPCAHIWVTTRPAAASLIPRECFNMVTEVQGFSDAQKDEFFRKNINPKEKVKRVIDYIKKNRSLHIMCHIPVFCWIMINVVDDILGDQSEEEPIKTLTEMYTLYSVSEIKRMNDKYLTKSKRMSAKDKGQFLVKLGKLAFRHLEKGTLIFYERDLLECGVNVKSGTLHAGVCTQIFNIESATTGEKIFSFVHLSVQEFLAALYVLHKNATCYLRNRLPTTWRKEIHSLSSPSRFDLYKLAVEKALQSQNGHLDLFVRFLLGLAPMLEPKIRSPLNLILPQLAVRETSIEKTVQYIKGAISRDCLPERTINLFYCLNELGDRSLIEEINSYLNSANRGNNLTPAQCSALAYLMLTSAADVEEFDLKKCLPSEEGLHRMLPVVKVSKRVWLNHCHLSKASCAIIASVLQSTPSHVRELDMSHNDLQDEGVELLLGDLQCKLETLRLNHCHLSKASCEIMALVLQGISPSHLRELDMSNNDLQDEGVELLCVGLRDPQCKLETLRLNHCLLSEASCEIMASVLQKRSFHLRELDMSDNDLQDEGVELLCVGLRDPQCKLETLRLSQCHISQASCEMIASALKKSPSHLRELDMSNNDLQDEGVELLCVGLRDPQCKLETLRMNQCHLSKASCKVMASVLQRTPSHLRELDMSDNDLQDEGVELLCVGLRDPQCKLETLRLSGCLITFKGCSFLASALISNSSYLRELDMSYNHPGDIGVRELKGRLNDPNCRLQGLRYDHGRECRIKPGPRQYACELTLDTNTAHRRLSLNEGNRTVTGVFEEQPYPDHPERFVYSEQVLCREGLSERCYWEAEWSGDRAEIAVVYKSIKRKEGSDDSWFGSNNKSWCLYCCGNSYSARHNNKETAIPVPSFSSSRVGVYLDWPAGTLSFYSVSSDTLTHLHTFHSTFTEPLYPGFWVGYDSSVSLCQIT